MPRPKKKGKPYKNKTKQRVMKIKLWALPVEYGMIVRPIDDFFMTVYNTFQVDVTDDDRAVFLDKISQTYMYVDVSGNGFLDAMEILFNVKKMPVEKLEPMRNLFSRIDNDEFGLDEIDSAHESWEFVKSVLRNSTYGEAVFALDKARELFKRREEDGHEKCVLDS